MNSWKQNSWPRERLGEALELLAESVGLTSVSSEDGSRTELPEPPAPGQARDELSPWFESAGARLGLEIEPIKASYLELDQMLRRAAPVVIRLYGGEAAGQFLLLARSKGKQGELLTTSGQRIRIPLKQLASQLRAPLERQVEDEIERLLDSAGVAPHRRDRARMQLISDRASNWEIGGAWQLGIASGRGFFDDLRYNGLVKSASALIGVQLVASLLFLLSWAMIGRGALSGHFAPGWIAAWCLTLIGWVPLCILASALQSRLSVDLGARLKRRLFAGGLRLRLDEIRHMGHGQLLGRVLESEAIEAQSLGAVFLSIGACIDLALAVAVFAMGSGGLLTAALLVAWCGMTATLGWMYYRRNRAWTDARMDVTHDLVERMVGHRTRLAQSVPERWHLGEDEGLERYSRNTHALDRSGLLLNAAIPSLWLPLGLAGMVPSLLDGGASSASIAISIGGVLLAWGAFSRIATSFAMVAEFAVAWRQVAPIFHAARREAPAGRVMPVRDAKSELPESPDGQVFLRGRNLSLRHSGRSAPVFDGVNFDLREGTHILLEGPSGCGKSSLASLLFGLREPESGLLMLDGLDRTSWGAEAWRKAVTATPQFHENHIFTGTLAFNLLFGRAEADDLEEQLDAERVCRELNLGDLIDRMPASLLQAVGETGWQLSHGERSRVFLARALLQRPRLCILDESLAALDPENLKLAVDCLKRRARSSLVIAHP